MTNPDLPTFVPDITWKYYTIYSQSHECHGLSEQILEVLSKEEEEAKKRAKPKGFSKSNQNDDDDEGSMNGFLEDCVYDLEIAVQKMRQSLEKIKKLDS